RAIELTTDTQKKSALQVRLGEAYEGAGQADQALGAFTKAAEAGGDEKQKARTYLKIGQRYREQEKWEEAEEAFQGAYDSATETSERDAARRELLGVWNKQGTLQQKLDAYTAKLAADPKDKESLLVLAEAHWNVLFKPEEAIKYYEKLRALDPQNRDYLQRL